MTRLLLPLLALGLLSGCANVHNVEVGAVPDDYRTRHPIVVGEGERTLDIPVTASDTKLNHGARSRVVSFASSFRQSNGAAMRVMVPTGGFNDAASRLAATDVVSTLRAEGVPHDRILVTPYPASDVSGPVPIKLAYSTLQASVAPCGRWPEDLGNTHDNRNYFNFGCASQSNLAAQIADPRDLLSPRGMSEIDAERRTTAIERYRAGQNPSTPPRGSEVNYQW
ncbi:CpaD family pilus assembly protein [Aureimonas mangrovi]|uniref:CpaD family pilus assembly protein n=1 Tax=Aureimonas mangrovi TaxID=2758041 RepID=UPI00163DC6D5|nr:CpaD family pilus assembly protein [Aureimonas mangrovi]